MVARSDRFDARITKLQERVGTQPQIVGSVVVDQIYAKFQHEALYLKHSSGGRAKYLYGPLVENHRSYLQMIASELLNVGPRDPMQRAMDYLSAEVWLNAPVELGDLRRSGSARVHDGADRVYYRPPIQPRLTPSQMKEKERLRFALGLGFPGGRWHR